MKRIIVLITTLIIGANTINAQWHRVNTNTTENLYDIFFVDSLEGYCVGGPRAFVTIPTSTGVILKTVDGGENWTTIFSSDSLKLLHIAVINTNDGLKLHAYGARGGIPKLITSYINNPTPNWTETSIGYLPFDVKVHNDFIFYNTIHNNQLRLLKQNDSLVYDIGPPGLFNVSSSSLLIIRSSPNDSIFYSESFNSNYNSAYIHNYLDQPLFGASEFATLKKIGDTIIFKGTYPSSVVYSLDSGTSWNIHEGGGEGRSLILESGKIISLMNGGGNMLTSEDFGQNWTSTTVNNNEVQHITSSKFTGDLFLLGFDGIMYKNSTIGNLSIKDSESKKNINIYPNPTKDIIKIETDDNLEIERIHLVDLNGKLIKAFTPNKTNLNIKGLPNGIYFLKFKTTNEILTKKVIIE